MRSVQGLLAAATAFALTAAVLLLVGSDHSARAFSTSGSGGTISIGTPTFIAGTPNKITIPVSTTATTDAYSGFNVHLIFNGSLLSNVGATFVSGGALETSTGPVSCASAPTDGGNGIIGSCNINGGLDTTSAGTLVNITLKVSAVGCSNLHLFTFNPPGPDNGNSSTGTYTTNSLDSQAQAVTYGPNVTVDTSNGATGCQVLATPTNTSAATSTNTPAPTNTNSPTATNTTAPAATSTPTKTATATNTAVPTNTNSPTATNTTAPAATSTPTNTSTATNTAVPTNTNSPTATNTTAPAATSTPTNTATATNTAVPTNTNSPTATNTTAPAATSTPTKTATATNTAVPTNTNSPTATNTTAPAATSTPVSTKTKSPSATPTPRKCGDNGRDEDCCNSRADFNHDGEVDFRDFLALVRHLGTHDRAFDLTNDGKVNSRDVIAFFHEKRECEEHDDD